MTDQPLINLGQIADKDQKYELTISNESADDAIARRAQDAAESAHRRRITTALFFFAMALVAAVFCGCAYVFAAGTADDKKWAAGILSAITSGLVGFLVGQGKR
jgi:hypothetical protein